MKKITISTVLFIHFIFLNFVGYSQVSNYTFQQTTGTYVAIAGTSVFGATNWDDPAIQNLTIPFSFNFNGVCYTNCNVSGNGFITFGATAPATNLYTPISSTTAYSGAVSAFGRDLVNNGVDVTYGTTGSAPNRVFVIQWNNARRYKGSARNGDYNFQIRLYETTNQVQIMYNVATSTYATAIDVQIGLRGASNADYNNRTSTTNFSGTTAGGANNSIVRTANTAALNPTAGLTFTWTPPVTTIANYISYTLNSPTACSGQNYSVSVTVQNAGTATWTDGAGPTDFNIGVKWDAEADYYVRVDAGGLVSCATATYNLSIPAPAPITTHINFNVVQEAVSWFGGNYQTTPVTVSDIPTSNAGAALSMVCGNPVNLNGSGTPVTACTGQTTTDNASGLAIPDNNTIVTQQINIPASCGNAGEVVSVYLNITHTFNGDLDIFLRAPDNTEIQLSTDNGGSGDNYDCTFITGGATLPTGNSTITGNYAPENPFINLGTGSAVGNWTLRIRDDASGDVGTVNSWSITVKTLQAQLITYTWTPAAGLSATNIANPAANPSSTSTYTLVTTSNGCNSLPSNVLVTVNNLPAVPTVSASLTNICTPQTVDFTSTGMAPGKQVITLNNNGTDAISGSSFNGNLNNHTMEFWVNPNRTVVLHPEINSGISGNLGAPTTEYSFAIKPNQGSTASPCVPGNVGVGVSVGTNGVEVVQHGPCHFPVTLSYATSISGWTHIAVVHIGNVPYLYINGSLVKTGLSSLYPTFPNTGTSYVYGYFGGSIENVRAWSVSRSQAQISADMNLEVPTVATGLINHLPLNGNGNALVGPNSTIGGSSFSNANYYTYTWSGGPALPSASTNETQTSGSIVTAGTHNYIVNASIGACNSANSSTVTITANTPSTAPTSISGTGTICVGNAVSLSPVGGALGSGAQYEWFTVSCGGTAAGTGAPLVVSPSATTTYYVRASAVGACPATACANGTVTLPSQVGPLGNNAESATCTVTENNWVHFYHSSGRLLASINSGGQNLGNVSVTSYVDGSPVLFDACEFPGNTGYQTSYMQRHWVITPSIQPVTPVQLRLPFTNGELATLGTASNANGNPNDNVAGIGTVLLSKYSGPTNVNSNIFDNCTLAGGTQSGATLHGQTANGVVTSYNAAIGGSSYVDYTIPGFSEFWLHGSSNNSPLPVELTSFTANCEDNGQVKLNWVTASEHNASHFIIEKSEDASNWRNLATVNAAGNSTTTQYYSTIDETARGTNYYRLSQVDADGTVKVYNQVASKCTTEGLGFNLFPNPAKSMVTLELNQTIENENSYVGFYDVNGKMVKRIDLYKDNGNQMYVDVQDLMPGYYIVRLFDGQNENQPVRFVKQ